MSRVLPTGTGDISGTPNNVTGVDQTVTYTITPTGGMDVWVTPLQQL